jgi:hypothetical protein
MSTPKLLKTHRYCFNPQDNGGESLVLETDFYDNGDDPPDNVFTNQRLTLSSYSNEMQLRLFGFEITPDMLRKLATELETVKKSLR